MLNLFKKKKKVILDTNILLLPGQIGIDIFTEIDKVMSESYEFYVLDGTLDELKNIMEGKTNAKQKADKFNAKLGFLLIKQKGLKTLKDFSKSVDDDIVELSNSDVYVATQDKELQKRVEKRGAKLLLLRQQKYFVVK
ncbi:MAG: PIN domain-containing protein [Candidatus Woesearchaeota archaeon]